MTTPKQQLQELLANQPDEATRDELLRALAFALTTGYGLADAEKSRTISDAEKRRSHHIERGDA